MSKTNIMFFVTMAAMLLSQPKVSAQNSGFTMFDWMEEERNFFMLDWIEDGYEEYYDVESFDFLGFSTKFDGVLDNFDEIMRSSDGGYNLFNQQFGSDVNGGFNIGTQQFGYETPLGGGWLVLTMAGTAYAFKKRKNNNKK